MTKTLTNDVEIELDGTTRTLRPTLKAATAISRQFGGFMGAVQEISQANLEAFQFIVRQGIPPQEIATDDLNTAVWHTGVPNLIQPVMRYVTILQNGGRDPETDEVAEGELGNG